MEQKKEDVLSFINVAAHFDESTLVNKKGQLLRIIKVYGFEDKDEYYGTENLRDVLRRTITEDVKDTEIAVYIYVKRESRNMMPRGNFYPGLASKLNDEWENIHSWSRQLMNALYVVFVYGETEVNPFDYKVFFSNSFKNRYKKELSYRNDKLISVTERVKTKLERFKAKVLTVKSDDKTAISEPLSFLYYLVHLEEKEIELDTCDLSFIISDPKFKYDFNSASLETEGGERKFYAIYTFKDLGNITIESADALLQLEGKFLITESFSYIPTKIGREKFISKRKLMSEDFLKLNIGAMGEVMDGYMGEYDYCYHSINILIYGSSLEEFNDNASRLKEAADSKGFALFREDLNLSRVFWSRLPGNMQFIRKKNVFLVDKVALFASIHQLKLGSYVGSIWGGPISIFKSRDGYPFYFNFHNKNGIGNTILIGENTYLSTIVKRFFIAQALRIRLKLIYINKNPTSKDFISALGGELITVNEEIESSIKVNIFHPDIFKNKELTLDLLAKVLLEEEEINEGNVRLLWSVVEELYQNRPEDTNYIDVVSAAIDNLNNTTIKNNFNKFLSSNAYKNLFNEDKFGTILGIDILNIDLSQLVDSKYYSIFLTAIVYRVVDYLPQSPFILCADSGKYFFTSGKGKEGFLNLLNTITAKNGIFFLSAVHQDEWLGNEEFKTLYRAFPTKIFLPNRLADKEYQHTYSLTSEEMSKLKSGDIDGGYFLIKQEMYSILSNIKIDQGSKIYPLLVQ